MQHPRLYPAFARLVAAAPAAAALTFLFTAVTPTSTQTAVANGDTRTISLFHAHRKDTLTVTFRRNGSYDQSALQQLNYFLRDWRNDAQIRMDPRLFDVIWEAHRTVGASRPVIVLSAYRSPTTNAMLRSRSRAVAKTSQHMSGKAMDMRFPDASMSKVREVALRMQRGGVGWYGSQNFVHLDVGSVRAWPRLSYDYLARLFPDGKTVHIAADGRTLPGYEEARAMVASRNGTYVPTLAQVKEKSFLARLFGWDEDDEADYRTARRGRTVVASAAPASSGDDNSPAAFFRADAARQSGNTVQAAAAPPTAAATARIRVAARTEAPKPAPSEAARPAPLPPLARPQPQTQPAAEPVRLALGPVPPRRPSQTQIEAIILKSRPDIPMPPEKPEGLIVVAEATQPAAGNAAVPLPPVRQQVAALANVAHTEIVTPPSRPAMRAAGKLPSVITQGTPVAANVSALSAARLLAYAPTVSSSADVPVRKVVTRHTSRSAPVMARPVGVRAATRAAAAPLVAARLDRSNFASLTAPKRVSEQPAGSMMGSSLMPLRAAAKHDPSRLLFAPAEMPSQGFTSGANPSRADVFSHQLMRQASIRNPAN